MNTNDNQVTPSNWLDVIQPATQRLRQEVIPYAESLRIDLHRCGFDRLAQRVEFLVLDLEEILKHLNDGTGTVLSKDLKESQERFYGTIANVFEAVLSTKDEPK